jgi:hypothetical protein
LVVRPTAEQATEYERACLAAWGHVDLQNPNALGHELHLVETSVEGTYPETRLVVIVDDERHGVRRSHGYAIWGPLFRDQDGHLEDPLSMALLISIWLMEPLPAGDEQHGEVVTRPLPPRRIP